MLLKFIHSIGLTNLSEDDVNLAELHILSKKIKKMLRLSGSNVRIKFLPHLKKYFQFHISINELAIIERDLKNLRRVIVIADHVENPESTFEEAVEDNFKEGVQYLFLVSKSKANSEIKSYYTIFESRAKIIADKLGVNKELLIQIKRLPFDWDNYPYILYQCFTGSDSSGSITYAFRGNEIRRGLSKMYESVRGEEAHTIAMTVTADAPSDIKNEVIPDNNLFIDGDQTIYIAKEKTISPYNLQ